MPEDEPNLQGMFGKVIEKDVRDMTKWIVDVYDAKKRISVKETELIATSTDKGHVNDPDLQASAWEHAHVRQDNQYLAQVDERLRYIDDRLNALADVNADPMADPSKEWPSEAIDMWTKNASDELANQKLQIENFRGRELDRLADWETELGYKVYQHKDELADLGRIQDSIDAKYRRLNELVHTLEDKRMRKLQQEAATARKRNADASADAEIEAAAWKLFRKEQADATFMVIPSSQDRWTPFQKKRFIELAKAAAMTADREERAQKHRTASSFADRALCLK